MACRLDSDLEKLPIPAIDDFAEVLADEPRWYDLGIHLEIPASTLNDIRINFRTNGIQRCLIELFKIFRFRRVPVTWYDICEALLHMGNERLVERIRKNYILPKMRHYPITPPISDESSDDDNDDDNDGDGGDEPAQNHHSRRHDDHISIIVEKAVSEDFHRLMMFYNDTVLGVQRALERLDPGVIDDLQYVLRERYDIKPLPPEDATMENIFSRLHPYYSFLNLRILEFITAKFLPDERLVQDELDEYAERLDAFKNLPKVCELMRLLKNMRDAPGGPRIIMLKLQEFWSQATLRNFEKLVRRIFDQLYGLMVHLRLTQGCVCPSWTVPSCNNEGFPSS